MPDDDASKRGRSRLRALVPGRRVVLAVVLVLVALVAVEALRWRGSVQALRDARTRIVAAHAQLDALPGHADEASVKRIEAELTAAAHDLGPASAVVGNGLELRLLSHLPVIGAQARGVRALRDAGAAAVAVARSALPTAEALIAPGAEQHGTTALQRIVHAVDAQPTLRADIDRTLRRLQAALDVLGGHRLWGPLGNAQRAVLTQGRQLAKTSGTAVDAAIAAHAAIGGGPHRYLVLLGNPAEERPGGGFLGVMGTIEVKDGAVTTSGFLDPNSLMDAVKDQPIPRPLDQYLFKGVPWDIADSNWSADFPTSAKQVAAFWAEAEHQPVDGVLSIDPLAIAQILRVLGPIHTPGFPQVITADNVFLELNLIANKIRPTDPGKDFLIAFGQQLVHAMQSAPGSKTVDLAKALAKAIPGQHLALFMDDPVVQHVVVAHQLDGGLGPIPGSDQLLVADANLSGGKNDYFVRRTTDVTVRVGTDGVVHHTVKIAMTQPAPADDIQRRLQPGSGGAYRDYLQLFMPKGALMTDVTIDGKPGSPESISESLGLTDIAFWTIVDPGTTRTITLTYDLPAGTPLTRFVVGKQLQSLPSPLTVSVTWPDGATSRKTEAAHDADLVLTR